MTAPTIDLEDFLQKNRAWIRTIIVAHGARNADEVDEVYQNVALAVFSQKAPIQDPAKVYAWFHSLIVNQTRLYCRGRGRYQKRVDGFRDENPEANRSAEPEPIDWLLDRERRTRVREALKRLSSDVREILLLKYYRNLNYKEIAEELETSVSAVQAKLHRARAALKKEIAQ